MQAAILGVADELRSKSLGHNTKDLKSSTSMVFSTGFKPKKTLEDMSQPRFR